MEYIVFEAPERCSECPCLRNNEYGLNCFLTEENLSNHYIDILYEVGRDCPKQSKENITLT